MHVGNESEGTMTLMDYIFLGVCVLALTVMVLGSKVIRAILWETLRHPFRASRIEIDDGHVLVNHSQAVLAKDVQPQTPAGAC